MYTILNMTNPVKIWLESCGKVVRNDPDRPVTHFMLDGGKLDLTGDHDTFQEVYAKNINHKNCIVERKTKYFRFFIDLDILASVNLDITEYIVCIQDCIKNIYSNDFLCIVCGTDCNKIIRREQNEYIKQGYHIHWPEIVVDKELALQIRSNIVIYLTTNFGKVSDMLDTWEKIVDRSVYEHNGLRLIGSDKCSFSDGKPTYENRHYIIHSVFEGNKYNKELTSDYKKDTLKAVKDTSIRTEICTKTRYTNLVEYTEEVEETTTDIGGFIRIQRNSKEYISIEKFFKNYVTGYRVQDIRNILKVKDGGMYIIESKSKYCQNIKDFHTNNHVFFRLTNSGLCQKCRSERVGEFSCCRDYCSSLIPINSTLQSTLGWKKPKSKDNIVAKDFSISNLLETLENNITGKDPFNGPRNKK